MRSAPESAEKNSAKDRNGGAMYAWQTLQVWHRIQQVCLTVW